jgi:hypothetical protein
MNTEERAQEAANIEALDKVLGKEARIMLTDQTDAMVDRAYAAGVSDAQAQARNPNHRMRFSQKAWRASDEGAAAASASAKTPYELAARAREIQDEAAKNGKPISNEDSVRMAYVENNIAWK